MTQQMVIDLGFDAIIVSMKLAAPALLSILLTGLLVSVFQAATQINEQTLSFIPKILAMTAALIISGPWVLKTMVFFTQEIFHHMSMVTQ